MENEEAISANAEELGIITEEEKVQFATMKEESEKLFDRYSSIMDDKREFDKKTREWWLTMAKRLGADDKGYKISIDPKTGKVYREKLPKDPMEEMLRNMLGDTGCDQLEAIDGTEDVIDGGPVDERLPQPEE